MNNPPHGFVMCPTCRSWVPPRQAATDQGMFRFCAACGASMGPAPPEPIDTRPSASKGFFAFLALILLALAAYAVVALSGQ